MIARKLLIKPHYNDVIMSTVASQITSLTIAYSTVYSGADQRKHQSSASLAFVRGIHRSPVNSTHKGLVTRKMFPFDDVIMAVGVIFFEDNKYPNKILLNGLYHSVDKTPASVEVVFRRLSGNFSMMHCMYASRGLNELDAFKYTYSIHDVRFECIINSMRPLDAYMRQLTVPSLVPIMACCLFGVKPLSEPKLDHC